jgi:hypothetical protein
VIWNILKKDLRILWPLIAVVAAVQLGNAALLASGGQFAPDANLDVEFAWISNLALPFVCLLGLVVLVLAVLHQDRLPGTTQDWLTRPIPRGKMLAAKMLLIVLAGLVPVLLCDIAIGVAERLHPADVIAASLTRTVALYCFICLPAVIVGIVTRSLTEALVSMLGVVVVVLVEIIALMKLGLQMPLVESGLAWTVALTWLMANILAVIVLLPLQLRWRSTNRVRWAALAYLCVSPVVVFLPWGVGFGLQRAANAGPDQPPAVVKVDTLRPMSFSVETQGPLRKLSDGDQRSVSLAVPVTVSESSAGTLWRLDHFQADLIDPTVDGAIHSTIGSFANGQIWLNVNNQRGQFLQVQIPQAAFESARNRHAVIRATLYMTSFRLISRKEVATLDRRAIDEFSRCAWTGELRMSCISTRPVGMYTTRENSNERHLPGKRTSFTCVNPTYAPWPLPVWRDPYYTYQVVSLPGVESKSDTASSVLSNYAPAAHFARNIEVPLDTAVAAPPEGQGSIDGAGKLARFADPSGVVVDSKGNLFIVDTTDSIVRKVSPSGEVITYAGQKGSVGRNDGPRDEARFNRPVGIAVDASDNLFVADTGNALIRRISSAGLVTTVAGLMRPTEVICASDGTLYVIDHNKGGAAVIRKVLPNGTVMTLAGPEIEAAPQRNAWGVIDEEVVR